MDETEVNQVSTSLPASAELTEFYAVYSELEDRLLINIEPSLWHFSYEDAVKFLSLADARIAARRRSSSLAIPVRITLNQSEWHMEPLPLKDLPAGGSWIIEIEDLEYPERRYYLMKGGRLPKLSMQIEDAKPYKTEQAAIKAEADINQGKRFRARRRQLTAQVVPLFP
ncbi:Uncharacterised protein [Pseudomonas luteola]|uniref:Uncharacterized protein n=1 Tax=Pseudomonas luteola TaxID=47886 RepID=A0A2X2C567_PSELU|nr:MULTISPECIES: hypothetical protein [Pseudomonas]SPZ02468.1 Uncharacterised protein [Pseudomonas luteola]